MTEPLPDWFLVCITVLLLYFCLLIFTATIMINVNQYRVDWRAKLLGRIIRPLWYPALWFMDLVLWWLNRRVRKEQQDRERS